MILSFTWMTSRRSLPYNPRTVDRVFLMARLVNSPLSIRRSVIELTVILEICLFMVTPLQQKNRSWFLTLQNQTVCVWTLGVLDRASLCGLYDSCTSRRFLYVPVCICIGMYVCISMASIWGRYLARERERKRERKRGREWEVKGNRDETEMERGRHVYKIATRIFMDGYDSILSLKMRTFWVGVIECELGWGVFLLYSWRAAHARYRSRVGQRVETTFVQVHTCVGSGAQKGRYLPPLRYCLYRSPLWKKASSCRLCNLHFTCCCGEFFMWEC